MARIRLAPCSASPSTARKQCRAPAVEPLFHALDWDLAECLPLSSAELDAIERLLGADLTILF